jgi:charged multivesicular body protein 4
MEKYIPNISLYGLWEGIYSRFSYKRKNYTPEDINNTINKLKNIQANIVDRINVIDKNIEIFYIKSKKFYIKKNKKSAIYNLKLKKMYEREKEKLDSINFNIESQIFSIESMGLIIETAETLKDTSIHMKSINNKLDIDKIESTMEELQENKDIGEELQNIFSESINMEFDEDDLLKELKEEEIKEEEIKEEEIKDSKTTDIKTNINHQNIISTPNAPHHKIINKKEPVESTKQSNKVALLS